MAEIRGEKSCLITGPESSHIQYLLAHSNSRMTSDEENRRNLAGISMQPS